MGWQEDQAKARDLFAQVKGLRGEDGKFVPDTAQKAANMLAEASKLMESARDAKFSDDSDRVEKMLAQFEGGAGAAPTAPVSKSGPIVQSRPEAGPDGGYAATHKSLMAPRFNLTSKAEERLRVKALGEGTSGAGGYLVVPQYMQNLFAEVRRQGNALRAYGLLAEHPVETNQIYIPKGSGAATVGIVGENSTKPTADQSYAQIAVSIYTAAGISKLSKQLVDDSTPTALDLAARELGSLLGNLEEQKIYSGSGTGEPRGILNTTLPAANSVNVTGTTAQAQLSSILDGIVAVQQGYFASPTAIVMHPKRWAFLLKAQTTTNAFIFGPNMAGAPGNQQFNGVTSISEGTKASQFNLWGFPVILSANVPTNLGAGTNQDTIFVANWDEAHWFQRQDYTVDTTDVAGTAFESNQVWVRLEERFGFSAERYPSAFAVLGGTGLV